MLNQDVHYNIALHLPLPDLLSLCNVKKFTSICHMEHFWLEKLQLDFPSYIINGTYKQTYFALYKEAFSKFKKIYLKELNDVDLIEGLRLAGEVSLYYNKPSYPYIIHDKEFRLKEDLFIAETLLWGANNKKLYPTKYLYVKDVVDINQYVLEGKATPIANLNDLNLNQYTYINDFNSCYTTPTLSEIAEWTKLGFIYPSL